MVLKTRWGMQLKNDRIIDEELAWHTFFWWVHRYWKLTQAYIEKVRSKESTIWEDLPVLCEKLLKTEIKRDKNFCADISEKDLKEFLDAEESL